MADVLSIRSRDNPLVKELRKLSRDNAAYRKSGRIWVEGDHLCRAALQRGVTPVLAVFAESTWATMATEFGAVAAQTVVLPDALFADVSDLPSPAPLGFIVELGEPKKLLGGVDTVVLDRVQDAGNVGSILRSAAAFGIRQVLALKGTAALWGPKVLRAGMGAHFGLQLVEGVEPDDLGDLGVPLLVTSSHTGELVQEAKLPKPCAWAFGHEGQGVGPAVMELASQSVRIGQPGGEESLNVAAAAAICLHAGSLRTAV